MAKFAPVAPTNILMELKERKCLPDTHLLLAHDVAAKPNEYRKIFVEGNTSQRYNIIMDNSVIELGKAVDLPMIREACRVVGPTTVVLPDVLLDTSGTIESCLEALGTWPQALPHEKFLFVPQGKTFPDFVRCAEQFADHQDINYWGIPRNVVKYFGSRVDSVEVAHILNPKRTIHMLGFSDDVFDDMMVARSRMVTSIDSAVPLRLASNGQKMSMHIDAGPRGDWWDTAKYTPLMADNIKTVQSWLATRP